MDQNVIETAFGRLPPLRISEAGIAIVDPMSWDRQTIPLPAGAYFVRVFAVKYPQEKSQRISRVQILRSQGGELGAELGQIGVDAATVGILDERAFAPEGKMDESEVEKSWQSEELADFVQWGPEDNDIMIHVTTGFGDGHYSIWEITDGSNRLGIEIQFIKPDQPYPF